MTKGVYMNKKQLSSDNPLLSHFDELTDEQQNELLNFLQHIKENYSDEN